MDSGSESRQGSWGFLTFRTRNKEAQNQQMTVQAELPVDFAHFSTLIARKTNFILSQSRLNALNAECMNYFHQDISPSFYHVQKPKAFLRPIITNLGNECIDPNISAENRQRSVQWITTELRKQTGRNLPGRSSHIENRVYDRFAKQGQFLFRFIHQYYSEIRKEMQAFIQQSRTEPQILELLDPNTAMMPSQAPQQRDLKPSMTSLPQSLPTASNSSSSSSSQLLNNLPPGISVQKGTEPQTSSPSQLLQKLPPGITIQKGLQEPQKPQSPVIQQQQQGTSSFTIQSSSGAPVTFQSASGEAVTIKTEKHEAAAAASRATVQPVPSLSDPLASLPPSMTVSTIAQSQLNQQQPSSSQCEAGAADRPKWGWGGPSPSHVQPRTA